MAAKQFELVINQKNGECLQSHCKLLQFSNCVVDPSWRESNEIKSSSTSTLFLVIPNCRNVALV